MLKKIIWIVIFIIIIISIFILLNYFDIINLISQTGFENPVSFGHSSSSSGKI